MLSRWAATMLVALVLALEALPAAAEPTVADKELARTLMNRGADLYAAKDYAGALEAFTAADAIMKVPTTALEVARAQVALGKLLEARDALARVTNFPVTAGEPEQFATARAEAAKLNAEVSVLLPAIVVDAGGVAGAQVLVDGNAIPAVAQGVGYRVNPGAHRITITAPGYRPYDTSLTIEPKEQRTITARLEPEAVAPVPVVGPGVPMPPPMPEPAGDEGGVSPLVYLGFGIGGACLVAGAALGGVTIAKANDLEESCGGKVCTSEHQGDLDELEHLANGSNAMLVLGGIGVVAGIVGVVIEVTSSGDASAWRVGPRGVVGIF
jgi:PEGA domain-containing protein